MLAKRSGVKQILVSLNEMRLSKSVFEHLQSLEELEREILIARWVNEGFASQFLITGGEEKKVGTAKKLPFNREGVVEWVR